MTIALGVLASDGVVIAADTQEGGGYAGGTKVSGRKIFSRLVLSQGRAFAATGAGSAGYLDALNQELADAFVSERAPANAEGRMRLKLREFYAAHMQPLYVLPLQERPTADVIVGLNWKGQQPLLLASEFTTMRRCKSYAAVGAGREHASMLLSRLIPSRNISVDFAARLAAYTIFHVKEFVEGCGKGTHVTVLKDGNGRYLSDSTITFLDYTFTQYLRFDATAIHYALGRPVKDEAAAATGLANMLRSARAESQDAADWVVASAGGELDWSDELTFGTKLEFEQIKGEAAVEPRTKRSSGRRKR